MTWGFKCYLHNIFITKYATILVKLWKKVFFLKQWVDCYHSYVYILNMELQPAALSSHLTLDKKVYFPKCQTIPYRRSKALNNQQSSHFDSNVVEPWLVHRNVWNTLFLAHFKPVRRTKTNWNWNLTEMLHIVETAFKTIYNFDLHSSGLTKPV